MEQMERRLDFRAFLASFEAPVMERIVAMLCNLTSGMSHSAALLSLRVIGGIDLAVADGEEDVNENIAAFRVQSADDLLRGAAPALMAAARVSAESFTAVNELLPATAVVWVVLNGDLRERTAAIFFLESFDIEQMRPLVRGLHEYVETLMRADAHPADPSLVVVNATAKDKTIAVMIFLILVRLWPDLPSFWQTYHEVIYAWIADTGLMQDPCFAADLHALMTPVGDGEEEAIMCAAWE
jgi:hypothetical protein